MSDRLFMHFKEEEDVQNLTGKLEDELLRIHRIVESATLGGIPIMNESFFDDLLSSYADSP
jgi:DNA mismatch repair protein MutS